MAGTRSKAGPELPPRRGRPATTPEARENELIALANDLVEKRMREGTASAQEVTHFLKLGSTREKLEQGRISMEVELMEAKKASIAAADRLEQLALDAINAMRGYKGEDTDASEEIDD